MLAIDLKKATILFQKNSIEKSLTDAQYRNNGDPSFLYEGYLYPEIRSYFETKGYKITPLETANGTPSSLFLPDEEKCSLTSKELQKLLD